MHPPAGMPTTRRRFLSALAGAAAFPAAGCRKPAPESGAVYHWSGIGFGIGMGMEIHSKAATGGDALGRICEETIRRIEEEFSLYQENSGLRTLNRERVLPAPSPLFRELLELSITLHHRTLGYFHPAIHGAWEYLGQRGGIVGIDDDPAWREQCAACDIRHIRIDPAGPVRLTHPLTRLSMNAIGQGFLADEVAARLRAGGVSHAMLHLGESRAIGGHPDGRPWNLAVMGLPVDGEAGPVGTIEFADAGLAVSANDADRLLIDPVAATVRSLPRVAAVVSTEGAAVADAFATAFAAAPAERRPELAARLATEPGSQVRIWENNRPVFERS